ncbi:MAG: hypothetical protein ACT4OJ_15490 [Bacteroidota bacterium]
MNKKQSIFGLLLIAVAFSSCIKKEFTDLADEGKTFVKILGGGTPAELKKNPIDFVNVSQQLLVADIRKDAATNASLNSVTTVVVKDDTAAVRAANPAYIHFPPAWYTVQTEPAKVGGMGGTWTFTFQPGDFGKQIYITIPDATLMNPSALYGLGFTITSVSADGAISTSKSIVIEIGAKNNWDGIYAVTGSLNDVLNNTLAQFNNPAWDPFTAANGGAWELHLITTGASECIAFDNSVWGTVGHPLNVIPSGTSGYGSFGLVVNFDPATNRVARIHNFYGDPTRGGATALGNPGAGSGPPAYEASNTRAALLDPSGVNAVQGNRDVLIKYWMVQRSLVPPPSYRVFIDETWKYISPR